MLVKNKNKNLDFVPILSQQPWCKLEIHLIGSHLIWNEKGTNELGFGFGLLWGQKMGTKLAILYRVSTRKGTVWVTTDVNEEVW